MAPIDNPPIHFLSRILKNSELMPHQLAIQDDLTALTFSQLREKVEEKAALLKKYGISPGDRVVYPIENGVIGIVNYLSIIASGATAVLLDPHLPPQDLEKLILKSEPTALLINLNSVKIATEPLSHIPFLEIESFSLQPQGDFKKPAVQEKPDPEVAMILYTSGTTGDYKGVLLTHENVAYVIDIGTKVVIPPPNRSFITQCFLPIYHIYPMTCLLSKLAEGFPVRFYLPTQFGQLLEAGEPIFAPVVPRMLEVLQGKIREKLAALSLFAKIGLWLKKKFQKKPIRYLSCGGASLPLNIQKDLAKWGFKIQIGYGLTESCAAATMADVFNRYGSVGKVEPYTQLKIDHPNEKGEGEICIQGKTVMKGYFKDPVATKDALQNGWLHTGDIGYFDSQGYLYITGRIKEIIILSTGKKAMPLDVEAHYKGLPGIKEIAVVGIQPKNRVGDEIHAAVVPIDSTFTLEQIESEIYKRGQSLEPHLMIQKVHLVSELPKTATLKIRREILKKTLLKESQFHPVKKPLSDDPIHQWIGNWVVKNLDLPLSEIDETVSFVFLGLDSLKAVQLCEDLGQEFQTNITLLDLQEYPTIEKLAAFCQKNRDSGKKMQIPLSRADRSQPLPLSFIEEPIWKYGREPHSNFLLASDFYGKLDLSALKKAVHDLFKRHEILRTTYREIDHKVFRQIENDIDSFLELMDLTQSSAQKQAEEVDAFIREKQRQKIDPSTLPLLRLTLLKLSEEHHLFVLLASRLILDGSSILLLFLDLGALYKNHLQKIPTIPPTTQIEYADFAAWENKVLSENGFEEQKRYWEEAFKKMGPLKWPATKKNLTHRELLEPQNLVQKEIPFLIPHLLCRELEALCAQKNTSLQTLLFSAYLLALHKETKQSSVTSRIITMGRQRAQLQTMLGHLAGSLPIQTDFSPTLSFDAFLVQMHRKITEGLVYSDLYGEKLIELFGSFADIPPEVSFNVSFNFYSFVKPIEFPGLKIGERQLNIENYLYPAGLDLDCVLIPTPKGIYGLLGYKKVLFDESSIAPIAARYVKILHQIASQPSILISKL